MVSPNRRHFLATTSAGLAGILAAGVPPARGQQREVSYLCWNNFAPASDKKLAEIGQRFTKDTGIKIRIDHIAAPQQAAKYASEVQTQAGHDIVEMRMHFPWLYEPQLVDLGDIVGELKKMGNPVGIPISQNYDTISTAGPVLWSFGGMEVDKDGKTVRINSPATEQMIEWYKKMFRDCMEPEVLSWTDSSNNEAMQQGKAGWIHNPVSAYIVARNDKLVTADGINHHR